MQTPAEFIMQVSVLPPTMFAEGAMKFAGICTLKVCTPTGANECHRVSTRRRRLPPRRGDGDRVEDHVEGSVGDRAACRAERRTFGAAAVSDSRNFGLTRLQLNARRGDRNRRAARARGRARGGSRRAVGLDVFAWRRIDVRLVVLRDRVERVVILRARALPGVDTVLVRRVREETRAVPRADVRANRRRIHAVRLRHIRRRVDVVHEVAIRAADRRPRVGPRRRGIRRRFLEDAGCGGGPDRWSTSAERCCPSVQHRWSAGPR